MEMLLPPRFRFADPGMGPDYDRHVIKCGACESVWECHTHELDRVENLLIPGVALILRCRNCLRETRRNVNADGTPWGADRLMEIGAR